MDADQAVRMTVTPTITVLTSDQKAQIHAYVTELLATVGLRVDCPRARTLLKKNGAWQLPNDALALPAELIQRAIETSPATVSLFQRTGEPAFTLGAEGARTRFGIGVSNLYYQDPQTDAVTPFTLAHMAEAAGLGQALESFDVISTPGIAQDRDSAVADLWAALAVTAHATKPMVLLVSEEKLFVPVLDLLEALHGDLASRPAVIPYFNPISPLVLNAETARNMAAAIERGLPFIYNNYGMSGATAPITPASTLVVLTAELLGGLVYSQLLREGAPVILGSLPAGFDMQSMMSVYTPHTLLLNLACAEMMDYYGLPHSGTSGCGNGWGPDPLAAGALWLNHLTSCAGKVGLAPFVGGNFDSLAFSPALVVLAEEVIQHSRRFAAGFALDPTSVALGDVAAMGPGGNFLMSDITCELFREMADPGKLWPKLTLDQWQAQGCPRAEAMLREYTCGLLAGLVPPIDHDDLLARGSDWIQREYGA
jgi:trimethylamine--corrinoid protein Co-methyltransferase